jgi:hypothetical protein
VLPTLLTVYSISASLEIAGRHRGGRGLFGWIGALAVGVRAASAVIADVVVGKRDTECPINGFKMRKHTGFSPARWSGMMLLDTYSRSNLPCAIIFKALLRND